MAGIVICHAVRQRLVGGDRLQLRQQLGDVSDFLRKTLRPLPPGRIVTQQVAVGLERRAAASGVDYDRVNRGSLETLDQSSCPLFGALVITGMQFERSAAALVARSHNLAALGRENPVRGSVHAGEEHPLHAAGDHAYSSSERPTGRNDVRKLAPHHARLNRWHESFHGPESSRQQTQQACVAQHAPEAGCLIQREGHQKRSQPPRIREQLENQATKQSIWNRAGVISLDLGPRRLDQLVVLNAGRTCGHARHAAETAIEVLDHRRVQPNGALLGQLHQVDSPARRVHLLAPQQVRRAGRQTEAAMDAVGDQLRIWRVMGIEGRPAQLLLLPGRDPH